MKKYISDHSFKMICIPRSNLNEGQMPLKDGIENESFSNTEVNNTLSSNPASTISNKKYEHLVEEEPLQGEDSVYPTPESDATTQKTTLKPFCEVRRSTVLLHLYIPFYSMYLLVGAILFALIEGPIEKNYTEELRRFRTDFLEWNTCVSDTELEELIVEIIRANNRGVSAARNVTGEPNWSFGQSFFFSSTIVTTIGYGHVHPLSEGGKVFSIIYAVIGIPMTFILITALVERCLIPSTWILNYISSKLGHLYQPFNIRVLHLSIIGTLGFVLFMVFPAIAFSKLEEDWNFLDALYYCFISLTTIGLGDYIPGDAQDQVYRPLYKVIITVYLILGLTAVMLLLHIYNDVPQLNLGLFLLRRSDEAQSDSERTRLKSQDGGPETNYTKNSQGRSNQLTQQIKVISQPMDSSTPEEDTRPVHIHMPPNINQNQ